MSETLAIAAVLIGEFFPNPYNREPYGELGFAQQNKRQATCSASKPPMLLLLFSQNPPPKTAGEKILERQSIQ